VFAETETMVARPMMARDAEERNRQLESWLASFPQAHPAERNIIYLNQFVRAGFVKNAFEMHNILIERRVPINTVSPIISLFMWGPLATIMRLAKDPERVPFRLQQKADVFLSHAETRKLILAELEFEISERSMEELVTILVGWARGFWQATESGNAAATVAQIPILRDMAHLHNFGLSLIMLKSSMSEVRVEEDEVIDAVLVILFESVHYSGLDVLVNELLSALAEHSQLPYAYPTLKKPDRLPKLSFVFDAVVPKSYPPLVHALAAQTPWVTVLGCLEFALAEFVRVHAVADLAELRRAMDEIAEAKTRMGVPGWAKKLEKQEAQRDRTQSMLSLYRAMDDRVAEQVVELVNARLRPMMEQARTSDFNKYLTRMVLSSTTRRAGAAGMNMADLADSIARNGFHLRAVLNILEEKVHRRGNDSSTPSPVDYGPFLAAFPVTPEDVPTPIPPLPTSSIVDSMTDLAQNKVLRTVLGPDASHERLLLCFVLGPAYTIMRLSRVSPSERDTSGYRKYVDKFSSAYHYSMELAKEYAFTKQEIAEVIDWAGGLWPLAEDYYRLASESPAALSSLGIDIIRNRTCLRAFGQSAKWLWKMLTDQSTAFDVDRAALYIETMFRCINARSLLALPVMIFDTLYTRTDIVELLVGRSGGGSGTESGDQPMYRLEEWHQDGMISAMAKAMSLSITLGCLVKTIEVIRPERSTVIYHDSQLIHNIVTAFDEMGVSRLVDDHFKEVVVRDRDLFGSDPVTAYPSAHKFLKTMLDPITYRHLLDNNDAVQKFMRQMESVRDFDHPTLYMLYTFASILNLILIDAAEREIEDTEARAQAIRGELSEVERELADMAQSRFEVPPLPPIVPQQQEEEAQHEEQAQHEEEAQHEPSESAPAAQSESVE